MTSFWPNFMNFMNSIFQFYSGLSGKIAKMTSPRVGEGVRGGENGLLLDGCIVCTVTIFVS